MVTKARSASPNGTLTTSADRTFPSIPRSNNQTSPRAGFILFGIHQGK
jgi:hypothetical protein